MSKYTTSNLQDSAVRHANPQDRLYRLRDGGGLFCEVLFLIHWDTEAR